MYKSRSRSMLHGAQHRDREAFDLGEFYTNHPPALTRQERSNFEFGSTNVSAFVSGLAPIIRQLSRMGVRKPRDVARELNRNAIRTATGDSWTPRLAYFLLSLIFKGRVEKQTSGRPLELSVSAKKSGAPPEEKPKRMLLEPLKSVPRSEPPETYGPSLLIKAGSKIVRQSKQAQRSKSKVLPGIRPEPSIPHADQTIVQALGKKRRVVIRVERLR